jgi:translation initiation factor eIF-2B subunit delta
MNVLRAELSRHVRDNLRDGASQLARVALDSLAAYADADVTDVEQLRSELVAFADELAEVRPSMTAIHNLVARWRMGVAEFDGDLDALRSYARTQAQQVRTWADAATDATMRNAIATLGEKRRLMTHSISSTVSRVLLHMPRDGLEVVVTESRPAQEGWNLASTLARAGVHVTYITDAQMALFVGGVDAVVMGADSLLPDGALVNKAGTHLMALAAREAGVPFYVCAESFKCTTQTAGDMVLEEKSGSELRPPPVPGIRTRNVYFEVTPATLVTDWLSNEDLSARFRR